MLAKREIDEEEADVWSTCVATERGGERPNGHNIYSK